MFVGGIACILEIANSLANSGVVKHSFAVFFVGHHEPPSTPAAVFLASTPSQNRERAGQEHHCPPARLDKLGQTERIKA